MLNLTDAQKRARRLLKVEGRLAVRATDKTWVVLPSDRTSVINTLPHQMIMTLARKRVLGSRGDHVVWDDTHPSRHATIAARPGAVRAAAATETGTT